MKKVFQLITIFMCLFLMSCKKELSEQAVVVRDCTGTYIRMKNTDYKVCYLTKIASFESGTTVSVSFKKIPACNGDGNPAIQCKILHQFESWIEVEEIRK